MDARTRPTVGVVTPDLLGAGSGLEFLRGIIDGKHPIPPIADLVGFSLTEVDFGRAVFQGTPEFKHYNPLGTVADMPPRCSIPAWGAACIRPCRSAWATPRWSSR
jgi:hypothetical protein